MIDNNKANYTVTSLWKELQSNINNIKGSKEEKWHT